MLKIIALVMPQGQGELWWPIGVLAGGAKVPGGRNNLRTQFFQHVSN